MLFVYLPYQIQIKFYLILSYLRERGGGGGGKEFVDLYRHKTYSHKDSCKFNNFFKTFCNALLFLDFRFHHATP